jgi:hypothetical protein
LKSSNFIGGRELNRRMSLAILLLAVSPIPGFLPGCSSSESRDGDRDILLTAEKRELLDQKLRSWSDARNRGAIVLEEMLRRDLRRESSRMIGALKNGLASGETATRAIAAAAIGFTEDVASVGLLLPLLEDPSKSVRSNAMLALCLIRSRRTPVSLVASKLEDPDPAVRRLAVLCLAELHDPVDGRDLFPQLAKAFLDADEGVRINATASMVKIADARAVDCLSKAGIADSNAKVRLNAAVGLGKLRATGTERALAGAMKREMNPAVRRELAGALHAITGKDLGEDAEAWGRALDAAEAVQTGAQPATPGGTPDGAKPAAGGKEDPPKNHK